MQYAHATCRYACMCELHAHYSSATWQTQSQDCSLWMSPQGDFPTQVHVGMVCSKYYEYYYFGDS